MFQLFFPSGNTRTRVVSQFYHLPTSRIKLIKKIICVVVSVVSNSCPRLPFASIDFGFDQKSSHFELSHDIDTQSIYGFDQIIHRQPSNNKLDQAMIARNFSRRTLNTIPQHEELGLINHNVDISDPPMQIGKPLRWFESESNESVHLANSLHISQDPINATSNANQRRLTILVPWRKQSQSLIHALHMKSRHLSNNCIFDEKPMHEIKKCSSVPEKCNIMHENEGYFSSVDQNETEADSKPEVTSCGCSVFKWFVQFFDLDLLRDSIYLNIMIGMAISIFAEINFAILTPFILADLTFDSDEISIILFVMAIADLISRFCAPFIADKLNLSIRVSYLISLVLLVLTRMCENHAAI